MSRLAFRIAHASNLLKRPTCRALSFDVFDTLLLRGSTPEVDRFRQIARRQLSLVQTVPPLTVDDLHYARIFAHKTAYATAPVFRGNREGTIAQIYDLIAGVLRLDAPTTSSLRQTEIDYEVQALRPHLKLIPLINTAKALGKPVIVVSDMYLEADEIGRLLGTHLPGISFDRIFVSSQFGQTKHGGGLYRTIRNVLNLGPDELLHLGDNLHADVFKAKQNGVMGVWLPRAWWWRGLQRFRDTRSRRKYGAAFGLNI